MSVLLKTLSGMKTEEQERMDERMGREKKLSGPMKVKGGNNWLKKNFWTTFLIIAGAVVLCCGLLTSKWGSPSVASTGSWSQNHWFWILILWGILAALVTFYKAPGALQFVLGGIVFMLFIGFPLIEWAARTPNVPQPGPRSEVPLTRAFPQDAPNLPRAWNADGSMTDPSKWPRIQVPSNGDSVRVPSVFGGHIVWGGSGFKVRYVYSDGHECVIGDTSASCGDGDIVAGYARNEGDTLLYASYAYARQDEK